MTTRRGKAWRSLLLAVHLLFVSCAKRDQVATTTLELWTISLRPTFSDYMQEVLHDFEKEHPGTRVRWVDVPFSAVERKLISAAAAGRAPDVVNLSDLMFARFAGAGAFLDLSDQLPGDPIQRYHPGALAIGELDGGLYALPWYLTTQARIINSGMLSELGMPLEDLASTWPELREQAAEVYARTGRMLFTQPLGQDSQLPVMMLADGLVPFSTDDQGSLRANLRSPPVRNWIADWVQLYRSDAMPRQAATNGFEHLIEVYQEERVAVLNTGANFLGRVRGASPQVYERTSIATPLVGTLGRAHIAVMPVCVSAKSRNPSLAAELAWFLTSPANQVAFCRLAPILPSTPESLSDPFFHGPTPDEIESGDEMIGRARAIVANSLADAVAFTPAMECWPSLRRVFNENIKRALLANTSLDTVLADIEREWNAILTETDRIRASTGSRPLTLDAVPRPHAVEVAR